MSTAPGTSTDEAYPKAAERRDAWIVARRGPRASHDPLRPQGAFLEEERAATGELVQVATLFLTNRECPWRCLMCDLWQGTLPTTVPVGAIPQQIRHALRQLGAAQYLKLYNSGSFFDAGAIPPGDHPAIAALAGGFERVIVESHPALVGDRVLRFRDLLGQSVGGHPQGPQLEVAMGLETVHPEVLAKLNKRMTLEQFGQAAAFLNAHGVALRVFVLVQPPFVAEAASLEWAVRSIRFAFDVGASVVSLIPTRGGNGALEALAQRGWFSPPRLATIEAAAAAGVGMQRGRVFTDLWDLERFSTCPACLPARTARLEHLNRCQRVPPAKFCARCER